MASKSPEEEAAARAKRKAAHRAAKAQGEAEEARQAPTRRTFELADVPNKLFGLPIKYLLFACVALSVLTVLTFPRSATMSKLGNTVPYDISEKSKPHEEPKQERNQGRSFLRDRWISEGIQTTRVVAPPHKLYPNDTSKPLVLRRGSTVPFPGRDWREVINHKNPLIRKIAEIRQAREFYLHQRNETIYQNKYRYMGCTMTRNEPHLKEFIIRNFVSGMEHMVIYDNNRVSSKADHDISQVVAPFVEAGIITYDRWPRLNADLAIMNNSNKFVFWEDCLQNYGAYTDWFLGVDSDEHMVYWTEGEHPLKPETFPKGAGPGSDLVEDYDYTIFPIHEVMGGIKDNVGAFGFKWLIPYNEHLMLKSPQPLLTAYPRNCILVHELSKVIYRPHLTTLIDNHGVQTKGPQIHTNIGNNKKQVAHGAAWLHYWAKSVEEWIWKKEQSFKNIHRTMVLLYDVSTRHNAQCGQEMLHWPNGYQDASMFLLDLAKSVPDAGKLLRKNLMSRTDDLENSLYLFFKWLVEAGYEWDEEAYLKLYPEVAYNISHPPKKRPLVDGLHHFLRDGYRDGLTSCWIDTKLPPEEAHTCFLG